jgi:hypothetical protein
MTETNRPEEAMSRADEALLADLARIVAQVDPPPELVLELGRAAYALRTLDSELADLIRDSETEALAVRGPAAGMRLLTFEAEGLSIELQVAEHARGFDVMGQVGGADPAQVTVRLEGPRGETAADVDELGMFRATDVPAGLLRVHVDVDGARRVTTSWVSL